ncbi:TIGR01777 family oxidoreductase [Thalassotalea sp. PLHSN55]|uniref:TIGR01777 family oxidoreductase n=1 Tax=Thalassotalea sp. PLHSN55 TaxID=3435888 RepID=UPI003F834C83
MKILITGATGLIGQALVQALNAKSGAEITVFSRSAKRAETIFTDSVKIVTQLNVSLIDQQEVIINLAGEPIADKRWSKKQKDKICQSRWQITQTLTTLIEQASTPPKLFISGSAIGYYGRQGEQKIDESFTEVFPEFSHHICQKWESIALSAHSENTRVALLRTGIVLSPNGGALKKMLLPFKLGGGGYMASGKQMMSWIHLGDMVNAILHIIKEDGLSGAINLTAPNAVTNREFSQQLATSLNRPCLLLTPTWLLKLLFGEMADLLIYGQNVRPKKLLDSGFDFTYPELTPALTQLLKHKN